MREGANVTDVVALAPDYLGFIFFEKSPRHAEGIVTKEILAGVPKNIQKVGVFVNERPEKVMAILSQYGLDMAQLHGDESPEDCLQLKSKGIRIAKAFAVGTSFDFSQIAPYEKAADFFLFDTKGDQYGGNGVVFDWRILDNYKGNTPFFLSGGIGPNTVKALQSFDHPMWYGMDVNSRFEIAPGLKDLDLLKAFKGAMFQNDTVNH